jgi:LacI family transcriptional regulator
MIKDEVTIYDIARELGLSASTVSRALSGNKGTNPGTRQKVFECAERLGYRANLFASNLRKGDTKTIGVIVHRLDSLFVSAFLAGAEKTASQKGYNLLIAQSFEDVEKEISNTQMMLDKRLDGLMVAVAKNSSDVKHFKPFQNFGIPLVFFDRINSNLDAPSFIIDNFTAASKVVDHLVGQGCKSIAHVTIPSSNFVYTERIRGFETAANQKEIKNQVIFIDTLDFESGQNLAGQVIKNGNLPDGFFFANDISAIGFIVGLQELGILIPQQVAVVGFNNDISCKIVKPNLSTINYPAFELGTMVANHLIEHILGNSNINMANQILLKSELIIRESSHRIKS